MKNWDTTAVGVIGAIVNAAYPLMQNGTVDGQTIIISVVIAVLGFLAKSFRTTGTGM